MRYFGWILRAIFLTLIALFLHYTLPQHDIVRITNTYEKRVDFVTYGFFWTSGTRDQTGALINRDIFFIETFKTNESPMIYRNEDTGWGWPPFFKFDRANLQAEASNAMLQGDAENPQWMVIRHYGWRNEFLSIYPNALSLRVASGPEEQIIPWRNILTLVVLFAAFWAIWVRWSRFRTNRIDPTLEHWDDRIDESWLWIKGLFKRKS